MGYCEDLDNYPELTNTQTMRQIVINTALEECGKQDTKAIQV